MNKTIKFYGVFLVCLSFLSIVSWLFNLVSSNYSTGAITVGIPVVLIAFILFFFPGIYYFKIGKRQSEPNGIIKSANVLGLLAFILLTILLITLSVFVKDGEGFATMYAVFLSLIIYIISTVMLIIGAMIKN